MRERLRVSIVVDICFRNPAPHWYTIPALISDNSARMSSVGFFYQPDPGRPIQRKRT